MRRKPKYRNIRERDGQWHYRFKVAGEEYTGPTGLDAKPSNRSEAADIARQKLAQIRGDRERADTPFSDAAGRFLGWVEDVEYRAHASTARRIRTSFTSLVQFFGATPVREIADNPGLVDDYKAWRLNEHRIREISLRHDLHALSVFFGRWAAKRGLAEFNPLSKAARESGRGVSIPSDKDAVRIHPLSQQEEDLYFERAAGEPDLYDIAKIMLLQGPRPEEVLCLRKSDYSAATGELRIVKGKTAAARRALHLLDEARVIVERRLKTAGPWLFPSPRKPGAHLVTLQKAHDRVCCPAPTADQSEPEQLGFTIYDFRHTFATRAAESGMPITTLAAILGHANLRCVTKYVHPSSEAQRTAMKDFEASRQRAKLKVVMG